MNRDGEDAAGPADADGQAGRGDLPEGEQDHKPQRVLARCGLVHYRVADPVHLREGQQKQPERDPADRGPSPLGAPLPHQVAPLFELDGSDSEPRVRCRLCGF